MTQFKPSSCTMRRQSGQTGEYFRHVFISGICKYCELPENATPDAVAATILALDKIQDEQLKADILDYYASQNASRFSSLNAQRHRAASARRQERRVELEENLKAANYDYKPLQFPVDFYVTPFYSEQELSRHGNPEQEYRANPRLELMPHQSGCKHTVQAATLLEGAEKALAEHRENCLRK